MSKRVTLRQTDMRNDNVDMIAMVSDVIDMIYEVNLIGFNNNDWWVALRQPRFVGILCPGYALNSMFKLNVKVVMNDINNMNSSAYLIESSNVWHGRLGHIYVRNMESDTSSLLPIHLSKMGDAILTATYLLNKIPHKKKEETPYELSMGKKPSYKCLRVWGYLAKVVVPTPKAQKIRPKSVDCIFIGHAKNISAYCFIVHDSENPNIQKNVVIESRNASFFENIFPCLMKETRSSSRIDDEVVQDKRQRDDNDLQDERQD
ncbi:retrotransposon protein, putative, ty1-copia subclass [Tanacetum coccineum]